MPPKPHILIVDDEAGIRESLSSIFTDDVYFADHRVALASQKVSPSATASSYYT